MRTHFSPRTSHTPFCPTTAYRLPATFAFAHLLPHTHTHLHAPCHAHRTRLLTPPRCANTVDPHGRGYPFRLPTHTHYCSTDYTTQLALFHYLPHTCITMDGLPPRLVLPVWIIHCWTDHRTPQLIPTLPRWFFIVPHPHTTAHHTPHLPTHVTYDLYLKPAHTPYYVSTFCVCSCHTLTQPPMHPACHPAPHPTHIPTTHTPVPHCTATMFLHIPPVQWEEGGAC